MNIIISSQHNTQYQGKTHGILHILQYVLVLKESYFRNQRVYKIMWSDVHRTYILACKDISYGAS